MSLIAFLDILLLVGNVLSALLLVAVILLQGGKGASMSAAFGGPSAASAFGARTDEFMVKATAWCAAVFLVTALGLSLVQEKAGAIVQRVGASTFETVPGTAYTAPPAEAPPPAEP